MGKLTNAETTRAKAAFKKASIGDILSAQELIPALVAIEPKFEGWDEQEASEWVDEFDEIGCGELDVEGFLRLCAEKDVFSGEGPQKGPPSPVKAASPAKVATAAPSISSSPLTEEQLELARNAFNDADEDLAAMIGAEGLHFALCSLNEDAFITWSDSDVESCLAKYDDIGCGEIDFETFCIVCVDKHVFENSIERTAKGSPIGKGPSLPGSNQIRAEIRAELEAEYKAKITVLEEKAEKAALASPKSPSKKDAHFATLKAKEELHHEFDVAKAQLQKEHEAALNDAEGVCESKVGLLEGKISELEGSVTAVKGQKNKAEVEVKELKAKADGLNAQLKVQEVT